MLRLLSFLSLLALALACVCSSTSAGLNNNAVARSVCLWIGSQVESRLIDETTKEMIIHLVEGSCVYAPSGIKSLCEATIDVYGSHIINRFVERFTADEICVTLHDRLPSRCFLSSREALADQK
ncbi:hypothetical protein GEMRC1_005742 [Eukaryota sp. GEM-RC1]